MYLNIRSYLMAMASAMLLVTAVALVLGTVATSQKEVYTAATSFVIVR